MIAYLKRHLPFFLFATAVLFLSFAFDIFGAMTTDSFLHNFKDSEALVTNDVVCNGKPYHGQLLETKTDSAIDTPQHCAAAGFKPYASQYGLQGRVYRLVHQLLARVISINHYIMLAELATALLSAVCFAILSLWVRRQFGLMAATTFTMLLALSPMLVGFGRNLYWALPLMIAPFIYVLLLYLPKATRKRQIIFFAGLAFLFYLRFLCGYEYVTSLTIMTAAAVSYHLYLAGASFKRYVREFAFVLAVAVLGFVGAFGTHVVALKTDAGSYGQAFKMVEARAFLRTADVRVYSNYAILGLRSNLPAAYEIADSYMHFSSHTHSLVWAFLAAGINYLLIPVISIPISINQPLAIIIQSLTAISLLLLWLYHKRRWLPVENRKQASAMFLGSAVGFAGFLSWLVLAPSHSLVHAHINGIVLYLPMMVFGYALISLYLRNLLRAKPSGYSATAVVLILASILALARY